MKQMDERYGMHKWRFVPRFLLHQSERDRLIDDAKRGGQHSATWEDETIFAESHDWLGEAIHALFAAIVWQWAAVRPDAPVHEVLAALPDWAQAVLGLDDLKDAFNQMPRSRKHARYNNVAIWSPERRCWLFYPAKCCLFGFASVVRSFNRLPCLASAAARRIFGALSCFFFHDFAVVGLEVHGGAPQAALGDILSSLGSAPAPEKHRGMTAIKVWLGAVANLTTTFADGLVRFTSKDQAVQKVETGALTYAARGSVSNSEASSLRGQAGWLGSNAAGRCGRIGLRVLRDKQHSSDPTLSDDQREDLRFLARVAAALPERTLLVCGARPQPFILYTDASVEEDTALSPPAGWVLFPPPLAGSQRQHLGRALRVPEDVVASWTDRLTQIYPAEAYAVLAAVWTHRELLTGSDLLAFVDNEAAAAALIRGAPRADDVGDIAQAVHWLTLHFGVRLWIEWVDSDSNPADGLSRDGLEDAWTRRQGWHLAMGSHPPAWSERELVRAFSEGFK